MAKNEQKTENKAVRHKKFGGAVMTLVVVAAVGVLGFKLRENPQLLHQAKEMFWGKEAEEDVYQSQINQLQQQLAMLQERLVEVAGKAENPDFSAMLERIDNIEHISVNTVKSKADVDTVLGLIMRMDNAEGRINDLSKVTDDGALILTAAMLVKDAGERGGKFVYEAEVLSELAAGHYKIAQEVARLNEIAVSGVPSVEELQKKFVEVYVARYPDAPAEEEELPATNWKERIYNQLNKVVKIKKNDEIEPEIKHEFSEEDRAWSVIRDLVLQGDITKAIAIAQKPINAEVLHDQGMIEWLEQAKIYRDFYESVSRISANALAVMKVKFLRN